MESNIANVESNYLNKKDPIHLGIAFDQNYFTPFFALLSSIVQNNKNFEIVIHAIVSGISETDKEIINKFAHNNNCLILYYTIDSETTSKFVLTGNWTSAVYYRLYFPLIVPDSVKRILYLDTDTLVINSLKELYFHDLAGYPVGAVYDNWVKTAPQLGIDKEGDYFNSGVLLIDINEWKKQNISEKAFEFLNTFPEKIKFVDQDALNAVLINNWKKLNEKYNFMYSLIPEGISESALKSLVQDKVIIHFTLQRPWTLLCKNRLRNLYFYYLKKSPAKKSKGIIDFSWNKLPKYFRIRLLEFYQDSPLLNVIWKKLKKNSF